MGKLDNILARGGSKHKPKGLRRRKSSAAGVSVLSDDSRGSMTSLSPMFTENHYVTPEQIKSGQTGPRAWAPPSHFKALKPLGMGIAGAWSVDGKSTVCAQNHDDAKGKLMTARCIKSYRATHAMELTIREGDMVYNVHDVGINGWLKGSVGGMYGHFPTENVVVLGAAAADFASGANESAADGETPGYSRILPVIPGQEDTLIYADVVRADVEQEGSDNDGDSGSLYDELVYDEMNYEAMTITKGL